MLFTLLHKNLYKLSDNIGVRDLKISDSSIAIYTSAYAEVLWLAYRMGDDFKEVWDNPIYDNGNSRDNDVILTFNAIEEVIQKHMDVQGEASWESFHHDISFRQMLNTVNATNLQNLVSDFCHELLEDLMIHFEFQDINEIEGVYSKYQFPAREELPTLELSFQEITPNEGDLILTTPNTEYRAHVVIDGKVGINGENKFKYSIDKDLGKVFREHSFRTLELIFKNMD